MTLAWLSVRCGCVCVLSSFSPPSSPYSGKQGCLLNSFSIELTVQCDGCLIWGLGWRAELVSGLQVGQAYGVFHRLGFGLLGSVPRSLSTQPPFATQALTVFCFPLPSSLQLFLLLPPTALMPSTVFPSSIFFHVQPFSVVLTSHYLGLYIHAIT